MEQKPSVGRVVHYHPGKNYGEDAKGPWAAIIAAVHNDTCVTLGGFNQWGTAISESSVCLGGPDQPGTWSWPPRV